MEFSSELSLKEAVKKVHVLPDLNFAAMPQAKVRNAAKNKILLPFYLATIYNEAVKTTGFSIATFGFARFSIYNFRTVTSFRTAVGKNCFRGSD